MPVQNGDYGQMAQLGRLIVVLYFSLFWAAVAFGQSTCTLSADGICRFETIELNTEYDAKGYSILLDSLGTEYPFTTIAIQFDGSGGKQTEIQTIAAGQTGIMPINDKPLLQVQFITVEISDISNLPDGVSRLSMGDGQNPIALLEQTVSQENKLPITGPDSLNLVEGDTGTVYPLANDRDPEGKTLRLEAVDPHPNLTLRRIANEGVEITAINKGVHDVNYVVLDPDGGQASGMITVGVNPKPQSDWPVQTLSLSRLAKSAVTDMPELIDSAKPFPTVTVPVSEIDGIEADLTALTDQLTDVDHADAPLLLDDIADLKDRLPDYDMVTPWLTKLDDLQTQAQSDLQTLQDLLADPPDGPGRIERAGGLIEKILQGQEDLQAHLAQKPADYPGMNMSEVRGELTSLQTRTTQILSTGNAKIWRWVLAGLVLLGGIAFVIRGRTRTGPELDPNGFVEIEPDPNTGEPENHKDPRRNPVTQKIFPLSALTANMRAEKKDRVADQPPPEAGILFKNSPMIALSRNIGEKALGLIETPMPGLPLKHDVPKGLQDLSGDFDPLQIANQATGRIGKQQEGVPTEDDRSMGTGFLICEDMVMTNHHVYYYNDVELLSKTGDYGIEFHAEKDNDESDFIPFNGDEPILIPGLDAAVFRLARKSSRTPISRIMIPTNELEGRQVAVIGYPDPDFTAITEEEIILVYELVEPDPVFATKRITLGEIFRHPDDTDGAFGIKWATPPFIHESEVSDAICHRASTMGGNSGSPIIDVKTGELLGIHFFGVPVKVYENRTNAGIAIQWILENEPPL